MEIRKALRSLDCSEYRTNWVGVRVVFTVMRGNSRSFLLTTFEIEPEGQVNF